MITRKSKSITACLAGFALCGVGTAACSRGDESPNASNKDVGSMTFGPSSRQPTSNGQEIFHRGVPLSKARALGFTGLDELDEAALAFPTVESCLVSDRAGSQALTIDWDKVGSDAEARVCVSRVAARLGEPENIKSWLKADKFSVTSSRSSGGTAVSLEAEERAGTTIEASWPIDKNGPLLRGHSLSRLGQQTLGHNVNVIIFVSEPSGHVSVSVVTNIL